ncbi:MAG TPA: hypothetical protein VFR88_11865, partial [Microlunatus sp.]|nr:hypothetical protein [Microlunatus sp.]
MDLAALTGQLGGAPQTQGWDAVVAIDATGMNQLLQNWFLGQNPNAPEVVVHTCFTDGDGTGYLLDVMLGAPQLSFAADSPAGSAAATMTRLVVSGQLLIYDPQSYVVSSVLNLTPDCASVTGELALTSTLGSTALGEVVLELGTGAWQASIVGLTDPTLSGALDVAVTSYYQ